MSRKRGDQGRSREPQGHVLPEWDAERFELSYGGELVKHFSREATDQWKILDRFQELGWPHRIENPLEDRPGRNRADHLYAVVGNLEHRCENRLIHFGSYGKGKYVIWRPR